MWRDLLKTTLLSSGLLALSITGCVNADDVNLTNNSQLEDTGFFEYQKENDLDIQSGTLSNSLTSFLGHIYDKQNNEEILVLRNGMIYKTKDYKTFSNSTSLYSFLKNSNETIYNNISRLGKTFFIQTENNIYTTDINFDTFTKVFTKDSSTSWGYKINYSNSLYISTYKVGSNHPNEATDCKFYLFTENGTYSTYDSKISTNIYPRVTLGDFTIFHSVEYEKPDGTYWRRIEARYLYITNSTQTSFKKITNTLKTENNSFYIIGTYDNNIYFYTAEYDKTTKQYKIIIYSVSKETLEKLNDNDSLTIQNCIQVSEPYYASNTPFFYVTDLGIILQSRATVKKGEVCLWKLDLDTQKVTSLFTCKNDNVYYWSPLIINNVFYFLDRDSHILYYTNDFISWKEQDIPLPKISNGNEGQYLSSKLSYFYYSPATNGIVFVFTEDIGGTVSSPISIMELKIRKPISAKEKISLLDSVNSTVSSHTSSISSLNSRPYITSYKLATTGYVKWSNGLLMQWTEKTLKNSSSIIWDSVQLSLSLSSYYYANATTGFDTSGSSFITCNGFTNPLQFMYKGVYSGHDACFFVVGKA